MAYYKGQAADAAIGRQVQSRASVPAPGQRMAAERIKKIQEAHEAYRKRMADHVAATEKARIPTPVDAEYSRVQDGRVMYALNDRRKGSNKEKRERYKTEWQSMNPAIARQLIEALPGDQDFILATMPKSKANTRPEDLDDLAKTVERIGGNRFEFDPDIVTRFKNAPSRNTITYVDQNGNQREYLAVSSGDVEGDLARILWSKTGVTNRHPVEDYLTVTSGASDFFEQHSLDYLRGEANPERYDDRRIVLLDDNLDSGNSYLGVTGYQPMGGIDRAGDSMAVPVAVFGADPYRDNSKISFHGPEPYFSHEDSIFGADLVEISRTIPYIDEMQRSNPDLFYTPGANRDQAFREELMQDTLRRYEDAKKIAVEVAAMKARGLPLSGAYSAVEQKAVQLRARLAPRLIPYGYSTISTLQYNPVTGGDYWD